MLGGVAGSRGATRTEPSLEGRGAPAATAGAPAAFTAHNDGSFDVQLEPRARGRALHSVVVLAGNFSQLQSVVDNSSVTEVRLPAGTYAVTSTLEISRSMTITADVEGSSVVLDGQNARRVMNIKQVNEEIVVQLVGLNITKGATGDKGGGVQVDTATVAFTNCTIGSNTAAKAVRLLPSLSTCPPWTWFPVPVSLALAGRRRDGPGGPSGL